MLYFLISVWSTLWQVVIPTIDITAAIVGVGAFVYDTIRWMQRRRHRKLLAGRRRGVPLTPLVSKKLPESSLIPMSLEQLPHAGRAMGT